MQPLSTDAYAREWAVLEDLVFSGRAVEDRPFRHLNWPMILLAGGLQFEEVDFVALRDTAYQFADREPVIVASDTLRVPHTPRLLEWTNTDFAQASADPAFALACVHMFAQSALWGIAAVPHEGFAVLAGSPAFIEEFVDRAGGDGRLRQRFLNATVDGLIGGEKGRADVKGLLRMVGWTHPRSSLLER